MSTLERLARTRWLGWANFRKWTACRDCGEFRHCGARRASGPFLCLDCYDQTGGR